MEKPTSVTYHVYMLENTQLISIYVSIKPVIHLLPNVIANQMLTFVNSAI